MCERDTDDPCESKLETQLLFIWKNRIPRAKNQHGLKFGNHCLGKWGIQNGNKILGKQRDLRPARRV